MNFEIKKLEQSAVLEILTDNDSIFYPFPFNSCRFA